MAVSPSLLPHRAMREEDPSVELPDCGGSSRLPRPRPPSVRTSPPFPASAGFENPTRHVLFLGGKELRATRRAGCVGERIAHRLRKLRIVREASRAGASEGKLSLRNCRNSEIIVIYLFFCE